MGRFLVLLLFLGTLGACGAGDDGYPSRRQGAFPAVPAVSEGAIRSEQQFLVTLSSRLLVDGSRNYIRYGANGHLWGEIGGQPFGGTWIWRGRQLCQTTMPPIAEGCQTWSVEKGLAVARAASGSRRAGFFVIHP